MNPTSDFNIWVIEDDFGDTEDYYLNPLEKIAKKFLAETPGLAFPKVNVLMLGLGPNQEKDYKELKKQIREGNVYSVTHPFLHSNPHHELSVDEFMDFLRGNVSEQDVVLVDPTAHGAGWWPESAEPDYAKALLFIYDKLYSWREGSNRSRLLLVSHHSKLSSLTMEKWGETADVRLPKLKDLNGYRRELERHLKRFFFPEDNWHKSLNAEGRQKVVSYVTELRGSDEGRVALRQNIGQCAAYAMLQVLAPKKNCARDLIMATDSGARFYFDPLSPDERATPRNVGDAALYRLLIRRRALYGLRKLYEEFRPKVDRSMMDEEKYKLWLEVIAAGYRWYHEESCAIEGIYEMMRERRLTLSRNNTVDLDAAGLSYFVKNSEVRSAHLDSGTGDLRFEDGRKQFVRFFRGKISFPVKGELVRAAGRAEKSKSSHEVRLSRDNIRIPENGALAEEWKTFWGSRKFWSDFEIKRHGHVEKMQKELVHRCRFNQIDDMLLFREPMPEEFEWWQTYRKQFGRWKDRLTQAQPGFDIFDPLHQCEEWL